MEPSTRHATPCRAVLFDVDDTLYEVAHLVSQSWVVHAADLEQLGLDVTALVAAYDTHRHRRTIPDALGLALDALGHPRALSETIHRIAADYTPAQLPAQRGVVSLLDTLRSAGIRTGVVTNGIPARQHAKLTALGLADAFDVVIVCDGVTIAHKPHPDGFLAALTALDVNAAETLMVGDRVDYDIVPALTLGMHAIRVRVGNHAGTDAHDGIVEHANPDDAWNAVKAAIVQHA